MMNSNLKQLEESNKYLYDKLNECEKDSIWAEPIYRDNQKNLLIKDGKKILGTAYQDDFDFDVKLHNEQSSIVIGIGLGKLLNYLLEKKEEHHIIIVVEPTLWMYKYAFEEYDFSKYIEDGTLLFATNQDEITMMLNLVESFHVIENWHVFIESYTIMKEMVYNEIIQFTYDMVNQIRCNTGTIMGAGSEIANNDIKNLPYIIKYRGVEELRNLYEGKPAVIVSTGPSLEKNVHELKAVRDKVVIVAVAQALRVLKGYEIEPDFICTVDYGKVNIEHFEGLMDSQTPLIALNRTYAEILKRYQGQKFIVATPNPGFENTGIEVLNQKGTLEQGGSVSHMCLAAAKHLGCNPIAIIGQDLAYEDDKSHISNADAGGKVSVNNDGFIEWGIDDPESSLFEEKKYSMGPAKMVPGYWGGFVLTNLGLLSFITSFTRMIKESSQTIINCTEGGAKIPGTKQLLLSKFIEDYCNEDIDRTKFTELVGYDSNADLLIDNAVILLKKDIKILEKIIKYSEMGLETNDKLKTEKNKKKIRDLLDENYTYSIKACDYAKKNALIGISIFNANRMIHYQQYGTLRDIKTVEERTKKLLNDKDILDNRLEANRMILESAKKEAEKLLTNYNKTIEILQEYIETKDETILTDYRDEHESLENVSEYFEYGNWAKPYLIAKRLLVEDKNNDEAKKVLDKAIEMREKVIKKNINRKDRSKELKYHELIEEAQKIGQGGDFEKSLRLLQRAVDLIPDKMEGRWGLATAYHHNNIIDKSLEEFEKLVKDFPDNHRFQFEYGSVLLLKDVNRGLEEIRKVMDKTEEFDSFLRHMGDLYNLVGNYELSILSYNEYLKKFEMDYDVWKIKAEIHKKLEQHNEAEKCIHEYNKILGNKNPTRWNCLEPS